MSATTMKVMALVPLLALSGPALADGLGDLKAALQRNQGMSEFKGALDARIRHVHGEGEDADTQDGAVTLAVDEGPQGLRLAYGRDTVARLDAESLAREKDPKAPATALPAIEMLRYRDVRGMTAAGQVLTRLLERSKFVDEK